jgi:steroid 5-alpha reductase family enzyme
MSTTFLHLTCAAVLWMFLLWLYQVRKRDAGIVDAGWALGLFAAALFFGIAAPGWPLRRMLVAVLAGVWGLRLGLYLLIDRVLAGHEHEDGRYRRMRAAMGKHAHLGFLAFFQVQAGFILLFALPLYAAAANPRQGLGVFDYLGLLVGIGCILGEVVSDRQLTRFRRNPANQGHTCNQGLWRYSRHPNYFFEITHWFAYICLAVGSPQLLFALPGPFLMLFFILFVTGVPHVEKQALSHRPDYAEYRRTTNMIIPWFPKKPKPQ